MNPLAGDLRELKDNEIESKISDLTKKYFMTNNSMLKNQIAGLLEDYKQEISKRRNAQLEKLMANRDKRLDNLIKVN
jgi:hypothetical protein